MRDKVRSFIAEQGLAKERSDLWVGVSGGVDSMVLLHVLRTLGYQCHVAHVDHGLRQSASDADRLFVQDHCSEQDIPFQTKRVNVQERAEAKGISVQMAARELRMEWFSDLVQEGPGTIALAHHQDDSMETMLVNLMRGWGSRGLAGIAPRSGPVIRPLLAVDRGSILSYAERNSVPFREDASNADPKYLRNRVRRELIPMMEALRPGASRVMRRDAQLLRELVIAAERDVERILSGVRTTEDGALHVPFNAILGSGTPSLMLHHLLRDKGFHPDRRADMLAAIQGRSTGSLFTEGECHVVVDREELVITTKRDAPVRTLDSWTDIPEDVPLDISRHPTEAFRPDPSNHIVWMDASAIALPLVLRPWRMGDRIRPLGMKGTKLVSDVLIDAKVPRDRKATTMVLLSGTEVVWVVGHVLHERCRVHSGSREVLRFEWTGA